VPYLLFSYTVSITGVEKVEWGPLQIKFSLYLNNLRTPSKVYNCMCKLIIIIAILQHFDISIMHAQSAGVIDSYLTVFEKHSSTPK
jgi:hypothetical protein